MKFKVNRDHFTTGLQQVMNVVGNRPTMPILSHVLIKADDQGRLALTTNNLDLGICCQIEASVESVGLITLPVKRLASIIRSLPHLEVMIEAISPNQVKITSGGSSYKIMGLGAEEFPPLPSFAEEQIFSLKQIDLEHMLKSIAYAQSADENRYVLNGIYFSLSNGKLTVVATDGRRLGLTAKNIADSKDSITKNFIVPARTITELLRLLNKGEHIKLIVTDRQVTFSIEVDTASDSSNGLIGELYLASKLVEGPYPNYQQVIPKAEKTICRVKIEREFFHNCIYRAALVTNETSNSVILKFSENRLEISASSAEYGESHESMAIAYEGEVVRLAFNPQFLLDPLKALSKDEIYFEFNNELTPGVIKTQEDFLCVIMPVQLGAKTKA